MKTAPSILFSLILIILILDRSGSLRITTDHAQSNDFVREAGGEQLPLAQKPECLCLYWRLQQLLASKYVLETSRDCGPKSSGHVILLPANCVETWPQICNVRSAHECVIDQDES